MGLAVGCGKESSASSIGVNKFGGGSAALFGFTLWGFANLSSMVDRRELADVRLGAAAEPLSLTLKPRFDWDHPDGFAKIPAWNRRRGTAASTSENDATWWKPSWWVCEDSGWARGATTSAAAVGECCSGIGVCWVSS
jgi:hypothetical protein